MVQAYRGAIGRTQTVTVHVTGPGGQLDAVQVYTSVDAARDPELADHLARDTLNVLRMEDGAPLRVAVPVLYHDPATRVLVLVLGDAHRHRELEERIAVLERLRDDPAAVPTYAKNFGVVFGGTGLRTYLAQHAPPRGTGTGTETETETKADLRREEPRASDTDRFEVPVVPDDESGEFRIPGELGEPGDDPLTTELTELPLDPAAELVPGEPGAHAEPGCHVDRDGVRLVVSAGESIAHGLTGALDLRMVLHRTPRYPVIALVLGPPAALRATAMSQLVVIPLDVAAERDRNVVLELGKAFALTVEVMASGHQLRRCRVTAPLADNVAYLLRAADDHLRGIAGDGEPAYAPARALVLGAGFDLLGTEHPERAEFRPDKLAQIATAQQLRRALAVARRFTRPAREDYLVCTRGFPLPRWEALRRDLLARAVAWGLWMGPELAQRAVSEGLARSRRDLVVQLDRGFEDLRHDPAAFDIDADAAADNAAAIAGEARTFGVELRPRKANGAGAIASDTVSVVSGSIHAAPAHGLAWSAEASSIEQLLAELARPDTTRDGRSQRVTAALALCHRADPRAAGPVIAAAMTMSRGDAVRVLATAVKFGDAAKPALLAGLTSSKAYLRHGAALALALLRSEETTQAVIDLLLAEPTELWREIARAVGQIGGEALAPLVARHEQLGVRAAPVADRIAWAMAHVGVRGSQAALEALAAGQGATAPVAAKALDLFARAASDHVREPRDGASGAARDLTVNHAFSRQFFEVLDQGFDQGFPEGGTGKTGDTTRELDVSEIEIEAEIEAGSAELDASEAVEP